MKFITVTELRQQLLQVVSEIEATKEQFVVTKNGKPVVLIQFATDEAFAGLKASTAPEVKAAMPGPLVYDKTPAVPAPPPDPEPRKSDMDNLGYKTVKGTEKKGGEGHGSNLPER